MPNRNSTTRNKGDATKARSAVQKLERGVREGQRASSIDTPPDKAVGVSKKDRKRS